MILECTGPAPDLTPLGSLRSRLVGRAVKVLIWQAFNVAGGSCGPAWETREQCAVDLLPQPDQQAARQALASRKV
ncbi:hypothetical protein HW554_20180 [Hymenobacter sp. P5342]|uniref:Uncharacterized protein n=2 Tax=Hymenobacter lapidiphilus TaxID=2608003 RepID=A0A7Y7U7G3_9BACT|nr:hypothetical protein [Hymenobacter lapidiphilus]